MKDYVIRTTHKFGTNDSFYTNKTEAVEQAKDYKKVHPKDSVLLYERECILDLSEEDHKEVT